MCLGKLEISSPWAVELKSLLPSTLRLEFPEPLAHLEYVTEAHSFLAFTSDVLHRVVSSSLLPGTENLTVPSAGKEKIC